MKYTITVTVEDADLGDAIKALNQFSKEELTIVSKENSHRHRQVVSQRKAKTHSRLPQIKTRLGQMIYSALKAEPRTGNQLADLIQSHGYSRKSVSPCTSKLRQDGNIFQDKTGLWHVAES